MDKSVDNFRLSVDKYMKPIMGSHSLWITFILCWKTSESISKGIIVVSFDPPYGPATVRLHMQPFDTIRSAPFDRIPCFIGYILGSTAENSVFQHWRYLRILPRLEAEVVGPIKHIFHTAVKYSK